MAYGTFPQGTTVTIATPFSGEEAAAFDASLAAFSDCTGITIVQEGSDTLEASLRAQLPTPTARPTGMASARPSAQAGDPTAQQTADPTAQAVPAESAMTEAAASESAAATGEAAASGDAAATDSAATAGGEDLAVGPVTADLAVVPQPGLIAELVQAGLITEMPEAVAANIELGWDDTWARTGTVDGTLYAAPLMASVKSFIWYSPAAFAQAGYEVPETWEELLTLTRQVVKDHPDGDVTPWCLGAADGATTGWPLSDWLEDALLATEGTAAYDAWAGHEAPLDDRRAVDALNDLERLLLAEGHVTGGGQGAVTTTVEQAGEQLVSGSCLMLHASSSFETLLPKGTIVTDGAGTQSNGVSTFLLPSVDDGERAILVGGDYLVSLAHGRGSDGADGGDAAGSAPSEARTAVMSYLTSAQWAVERVSLGGVASANRGARGVSVSSPVAEAAFEILQSRQSVIRFDASDMMPSQVGTRVLWDALVGWAKGDADAARALRQAEEAWPAGR
ncbi:carbohydrate ABC transporter substrate-binding protein [Actinomyces respiraculi]|uniref:Carbohydrate ABC transporter substrate-binding protein n=2 Tax=Actinomycetaceae TaxID=2049 RepID=A0A7T0PYB3_9ACTO|nr:carbohydrate ABC transporter substrate-binding protein [Actinomyces respiraculi]